VVKPNCSKCLNDEGYGWICDRDPKTFEPESELVRNVDRPGYHRDFSGIPKGRKIYCRNFIPEDWQNCTYTDGRWHRNR